MRCFFAMLFCLFFLRGEAQLLNPATDWFEATSFFNEKTLANRNISDIHLLIVDKKDGAIIIDRGTFLHYEFGTNGKLKQFVKSIKLAQKIDTAVVDYYYNYDNQVVRRSEQQGAFHYSFIYEYQYGLPVSAIKIDENTYWGDTLYKRKLKSEKKRGELIVSTLNNKGIPYKVKKSVFENDTLKTERITYLRNQNYTEKSFAYEGGKLETYKNINFFQKKQESVWKYEYENGVLITAMLYENGEKAKKRAFTFRDDGLIGAVVERNYIEKSIRIYSFLYLFGGISYD